MVSLVEYLRWYLIKKIILWLLKISTCSMRQMKNYDCFQFKYVMECCGKQRSYPPSSVKIHVCLWKIGNHKYFSDLLFFLFIWVPTLVCSEMNYLSNSHLTIP